MVKEKPNSTRIYDKDGFRQRAACICVRSTEENEVLLVTSSRRPDNWIVPGGGVEPNEEPSCTAVREVLEEAGVVGTLGRCLGMFENFEHKHRTKVFVMNVTEELADWEDSRNMNRKRQWFTIDEALQQLALHKPVQRRYLQQLKNSSPISGTTALRPQIPESSNSLAEQASSNNVATTTTIQQSTSKTAAAL